MNKHIQIITLPDEIFNPTYLVSHLVELWRNQGHRVSIGPFRQLDADIGIMHVDRTLVPVQCLPDNPQRRPLLNSSLLDISKRRVSNNLVERDSDYSGQVIVKTDANFFGWPERAALYSWPLLHFYYLFGNVIPWRLARNLFCGAYPVLESLGKVPQWVWQRDDLVVEKFLPEVEGDEFVLRIWVFFGDQEYGARLFGRNPVVKVKNMTRYEYINDVPDTIRQARSNLGMDFGKIDYVVVNGRAVLLDVNKTPTLSAERSANSNRRRLALGLADYLERKI